MIKSVFRFWWLEWFFALLTDAASPAFSEGWTSLLDFLAEEMRFGVFDEWNIDCCSELTFLLAPVLLNLVSEILNLGFSFLKFFKVRADKASIFSFVFEEVLLSSCVLVHVVVYIFDPLHYGHVFDVVNHVKIHITPLVFIRVGISFVFCGSYWLWKLDEQVDHNHLADTLWCITNYPCYDHDVVVLRSWIHKCIKCEKLKHQNEESMHKEYCDVQTHCLLIYCESVVLVERLFKSSQGVRKEAGRKNQKKSYYCI